MKRDSKKNLTFKEIDAMSDDDVLVAVRAIYDSQRRDDVYEPNWVAMFWAGAYGDSNEADLGMYRSYLESVADSPHIATRMFGEEHVQEDGFLVATTSWIFAGRKSSTPIAHRGWIIIDREFSDGVKALERANRLGKGMPTHFWMAYSTRGPVGMSAMSGDEIGPCTSLAEVKAYIDEVANPMDDRGPSDPRGRWGASAKGVGGRSGE